MTTYVNMEDMRGHLRHGKSSATHAHEILMILGERYERMAKHGSDQAYSIKAAGLRFYDIRRHIEDASDTTIQRSINWLLLDELIETEYWKHKNRRYFFTLHGLQTYLKKAKHDEESESLFSEEDMEQEQPESKAEAPKEQQSDQDAGKTALELEPTFLDEKTRINVDQEIARLQLYKLADKINRLQGDSLISVQNDHTMIMISGSHADMLQRLIAFAGVLGAS